MQQAKATPAFPGPRARRCRVFVHGHFVALAACFCTLTSACVSFASRCLACHPHVLPLVAGDSHRASGQASQERKKGLIGKLIVASKGSEPGYIIRSLQVGGKTGEQAALRVQATGPQVTISCQGYMSPVRAYMCCNVKVYRAWPLAAGRAMCYRPSTCCVCNQVLAI